jgi:hypothetical protein
MHSVIKQVVKMRMYANKNIPMAVTGDWLDLSPRAVCFTFPIAI